MEHSGRDDDASRGRAAAGHRLAAGRAAASGAPLGFTLLFEGFRRGARAQLLLGVVYFLCLAAVLGTTALADGGAVARWVLTGERPNDEMLQSPDLYTAFAIAAALYAPVMMMFWFAPVLAAWHDVPTIKAMFFSIVSCWRNRGAFIVYGALWFAVATTVSFGLSALLQALGAGELALVILMPASIIVTTMLYCSFYATYRGCFGVQSPGQPLPPAPTSSSST